MQVRIYAVCIVHAFSGKLICVSGGFVFIVSDSNTTERTQNKKKKEHENRTESEQDPLNTFHELDGFKESPCRKARNVCISASRLNIKEKIVHAAPKKKRKKMQN